MEEVCAGGNGTGNSTLWAHLDDVEEAFLRYKVRGMVVSVRGVGEGVFDILYLDDDFFGTPVSAHPGLVFGMQGVMHYVTRQCWRYRYRAEILGRLILRRYSR